MNVYFEEIDADELDRETIFSETDTATLHKWLAEQRMIKSEIQASMGAYKGTGVCPSAGVIKKLGFTNIAVTWIVNRLCDLGEESHLSGVDGTYEKLKRQLAELEAVLVSRNTKIKNQATRITQLEAALALTKAA